jgi:hypothetical protein
MVVFLDCFGFVVVRGAVSRARACWFFFPSFFRARSTRRRFSVHASPYSFSCPTTTTDTTTTSHPALIDSF